nr:dynamin family protein [uncultured Enterobacter sp.]
MPNNVLQGHQSFYRNLHALHDELKTIESDVKSNEQQFFSQIKQLDLLLKKNNVHSDSPDPLRQFYSATLAHISVTVREWIQRIDHYELNTSFRKHYGDSLLVYIYGKVKAGKSSLGNYMAYGHEKVTPEWRETMRQQGHEPQFFVAEKGEDSLEDTSHRGGFYVDSAEATSCIQGFTLPGLTWIDSPGIHSITPDNQQLAQKYVESADLIIYPMNSAQPGRATDMSEIRELMLKRKRLLLLITRCDAMEEDEDEEGNIVAVYQMKSDDNRRMQETYLKNTLIALSEEMGITDLDCEVLTLSVRYAAIHGNTPEALNASGVQAFINKLEKTLNSEGIALKKQVPRNALQAFYDFLLSEHSEGNNLHALQTSLNELMTRVDELRLDVKHRCEAIKTIVSNDVALKIDASVDAYTQHRDAKKLEREIVSEVRKHLQDKLSPLLNDVTQSLALDVNAMTQSLHLKSHIRLDPVSQTIEIDSSGRNGAIGAGIGAVVVGGIAGFFSGGLAAGIGSAVGGTVGRFLGGMIHGSRSKSINVGDNRMELVQRLTEMTSETIASAIDKTRFDIDCQLLTPVHKAVTELADKVECIRNWIVKDKQKEKADVF